MYNVIKIYYLSTCHLSIYLSIIYFLSIYTLGFPGRTSGNESACQCKGPKRLGLDPWIRKISWSRKQQPTPQSWTRLKRLSSSSSRYSCLENPVERGAWWATVHGVGHKELDMSEHTCTHTSVIYYLSSIICVSPITYPSIHASLYCLLSLLLTHSPTHSLLPSPSHPPLPSSSPPPLLPPPPPLPSSLFSPLLPPSLCHSHKNFILFSVSFRVVEKRPLAVLILLPSY